MVVAIKNGPFSPFWQTSHVVVAVIQFLTRCVSEVINRVSRPLKCPLSVGAFRFEKTIINFALHGSQRKNAVFFDMYFFSFNFFS